MSNTMNNGDILIISLHDDDRYLQLSGVMAVALQMIDGKTNWRKIIDRFFSWQYDTEEIQSIYKIISHILENNDFIIREIQAFKTDEIQIMTLAHPNMNPTTIYADAYDDTGSGSTLYHNHRGRGWNPWTGLYQHDTAGDVHQHAYSSSISPSTDDISSNMHDGIIQGQVNPSPTPRRKR